MISSDQVFVADARTALASAAQRSAYVFGAASPLGEALLAQILASSAYTAVHVSTTAPLPATVAHLHGMVAGPTFSLQDTAQSLDCILIVDGQAPSAMSPQAAAVPRELPSELQRFGFLARSNVYAPLHSEAVPALLRSVSSTCLTPSLGSHASSMPHTSSLANVAQAPNVRYLVLAPHLPLALASSWLQSYSAHAPCMVYGLADGARALSAVAYRFKPVGTTVLDRLGVWVLNMLSSTAHGMLNANDKPPLTQVKTAQRLAARFAAFDAKQGITALSPADLQTV